VEKLEQVFKKCPLVEELWVYGNSLESTLVAVVVPAHKHLVDWAQQAGVQGGWWGWRRGGGGGRAWMAGQRRRPKRAAAACRSANRAHQPPRTMMAAAIRRGGGRGQAHCCR
jgi:hypothetical protein